MLTHIVLYTEFISTIKQQKEQQQTFLAPHTPLTHAPTPISTPANGITSGLTRRSTPSSGAGFDTGSKGWWSEVCEAWPLADVEEGRLVACTPTSRVAVDTLDVEVEVEVLLVLDVEVKVEVETPALEPDAAAWACGGEGAAASRGGGTGRGRRPFHRVCADFAVAEEAEVEVDTPEHEVEVETPELEASGRARAAAPGGGGTAKATVGREFSGLVNCAMGKNKQVSEYNHKSENENK
jgi:hypothetical protein